MGSIGFPVFVVTILLAGTTAAIVLTPKDLMRSSVVKTPSPFVADVATPGANLPRPAETAVPVIQVASMTVEVTPLSEPQAFAEVPSAPVLPVQTQPEPQPQKDIRRITAGALNMRTEPNKDAGLVASLPRGTEVEVSETAGSWAYVSTADGTTGWLSQNFLTAAD